MPKIERALISVSDKDGIVELAKELNALDVEIISTGGTYNLLKENGIEVISISSITGFPEILDGRVKSLHPAIFGGILAKKDDETHIDELTSHSIDSIDLVVVNLYPFEKVIAQNNISLSDAIENIDIGGVTLLRAAAKNFNYVTTVTERIDYQIIIDEMKNNNRDISLESRKQLSVKAFQHTSRYDALISEYLAGENSFPELLNLPLKKNMDLRYGENPHQKAKFYDCGKHKTVFKQLQGKELSYNNLMDFSAVLEMLQEFDEPCAVIVKHTNPCGIATAVDHKTAFVKALSGDPLSAFGGIIGINGIVDGEIADEILKTGFMEVVIAEQFTEEGLQAFSKKKNCRLIEYPVRTKFASEYLVRPALNGILVQERDDKVFETSELSIVTEEQPDDELLKQLIFAFKVVKHVKSNAVVLCRDFQLIGLGAGQTSRVDSVKIAIEKAVNRLENAVIASDAYFPFRDSIDQLAKHGIKAIIQPGGSIRDKKVISACNEHRMIMCFTGMRHFKH